MNQKIEAICHNYHDLVKGSLQRIREHGCELVSEHESANPYFVRESKVLLNIVDPGSGQVMNVPAELQSVSRKQGKWVYVLLWKRLPEVLSHADLT